MVLFGNILILILGFILLGLSGHNLVETSVHIARRWKIPPIIIAVTIISAATSAPEFFTSLLAGLQNQNDISVGNVIGSNTFNILIVGGVSLILHPHTIIISALFPWLALVLTIASFFLFFSLQDSQIISHEGFLLLGGLGFFFFLSWFFRKKEKVSDFEYLESRSIYKDIFFFILSISGLIFGAKLALNQGIVLGEMAGLSKQVIAITIIAVGTGLPELATSIAAVFQKHIDIAIGNVIGSNIFNTLAIPGIVASISPLAITEENIFDFDFYVMGGATLSLFLLYMIKTPQLRKWIGGVMVISYCVYIMGLL